MEEQLAWYRSTIALRNAFPALRTGSFRTLITDDGRDVWVFLRELDGEQVLVALNAGENDQSVDIPHMVESGGTWREVFSSAASPTFVREGRPADELRGDHFPTVTIPAVGGRVWERRK
jgi:hypothetical protein